jgi:hypothetical protein
MVICLLLVFSVTGWAKKTKPIMAIAGFGVNQVDDSQNPGLSAPFVQRGSTQVVLGGEYYLQSGFSLQLDLMIGEQQYVGEPVAGRVISESSMRLHFPLLVRYTFFNQLSLALGGFASYRLGTVNPLVPIVDEINERTSAHNYGNHGLEGSVRFLLPLAPAESRGFVIDFRQRRSLTPIANEKLWHQSFFVAFCWLIG